MNWYEDDELWQNFYHCMFDEESFDEAQKQIPLLLSLICHPVQSVLDLACGPGRHALALSQKGLQVTAVDSSAFLLSKAKGKVADSSTRFIQADMLDYKADKKFDLAINMFNSFGYFDSHEKNQAFIQQTYENLAETGTFLIDTVGKETLARSIEPVHLTEYSNGDIRIERPLLIDNLQIFSNEWLLIRKDKVFRRQYQHYVYTPMEITQMCLQAGFTNVEVFGSLAGDDYKLDSERLVVVAEKF